MPDSKTQIERNSKQEDLMDVLSNHIIDLMLENPEKYILKQPKKGVKVKEICRNVTQ